MFLPLLRSALKLCIYVVSSGNLYVTVCAIINYDRIMSLFIKVRLKKSEKFHSEWSMFRERFKQSTSQISYKLKAHRWSGTSHTEIYLYFINPSTIMYFKCQLLPRTERCSVHSTLTCIHIRTMHQDVRHVKIKGSCSAPKTELNGLKQTRQ